MKNDKENNQEVNVETNNDAVLYSVMLSFLKKRAKKEGLPLEELYIQIDEENETIDLYHVDCDERQPMFIEQTRIN